MLEFSMNATKEFVNKLIAPPISSTWLSLNTTLQFLLNVTIEVISQYIAPPYPALLLANSAVEFSLELITECSSKYTYLLWIALLLLIVTTQLPLSMKAAFLWIHTAAPLYSPKLLYIFNLESPLPLLEILSRKICLHHIQQNC